MKKGRKERGRNSQCQAMTGPLRMAERVSGFLPLPELLETTAGLCCRLRCMECSLILVGALGPGYVPGTPVRPHRVLFGRTGDSSHMFRASFKPAHHRPQCLYFLISLHAWCR